jgi:hypothetical protein
MGIKHGRIIRVDNGQMPGLCIFAAACRRRLFWQVGGTGVRGKE